MSGEVPQKLIGLSIALMKAVISFLAQKEVRTFTLK
jgi:hypothetical protein